MTAVHNHGRSISVSAELIAIIASGISMVTIMLSINFGLRSEITELRREIANSEAELRRKIANSEAELRREIANSEAELREEIRRSEDRIINALISHQHDASSGEAVFTIPPGAEPAPGN